MQVYCRASLGGEYLIDFRDLKKTGSYLGIWLGKQSRLAVGFVDIFSKEGEVPYDCTQSNWLDLLIHTGVSKRQIEEVVRALHKEIYNFGACEIVKYLSSGKESIDEAHHG